jgi:hypothetical protein
VTVQSWTREGDKIRCHHGTLIDPSIEQCPKCVADPPVDRDDANDPLPAPPTGCVTSEGHEAAFTALAVSLEAVGLEMIQSDGRIDIATGKELLNSALRARSEATRLTIQRESEHIVRTREKRIMDRMRGSH